MQKEMLSLNNGCRSDNPPVRPEEKAGRSTDGTSNETTTTLRFPTQLPTFSSSLHGFSCKRGELWLSDQEHASIGALLEPLGYSFKLVETETATPGIVATKRRKTLVTATLAPSDGTAVMNGATQDDSRGADTSDQQRGALPRDGMRFTSEGRSRRKTEPRLSSSADRKRTARTSGNGGDAPLTPATGPLAHASDPRPGVRSPKPQTTSNIVPARMSRRRREVLTGTWTDACLAVTELLEKEPAARWFLAPVDPATVPDYLDKITCPMDLQTVRQKLTHGMYTHPFRWQEDIRTIFFNAFTYHSAGNLVWSDALYLASLFEQLCKVQEKFANAPLVCVSIEIPLPQEHVGVNPYAVYAPPRKTGNAKSEASEGSVTAAVTTAAPDSRSDTIVLEASKLRELLARAATAAATHQQVQDVEKEEPPPPPPPPAAPPQKLRPGDKGPNIVHRRLIAVQFRQLDVHLRHAIMELIKDELGVSAVAAACDPDFVIDFELLPYLKQKQLMAYLRTLDAFQRKMVEEGYRPTLVTRDDGKAQQAAKTAAAPSPVPTTTVPSASLPRPSSHALNPVTPFSSQREEERSSSSSSSSSTSSDEDSDHDDDDTSDLEDGGASMHPTSPTVASSATTTSLGSHSSPATATGPQFLPSQPLPVSSVPLPPPRFDTGNGIPSSVIGSGKVPPVQRRDVPPMLQVTPGSSLSSSSGSLHDNSMNDDDDDEQESRTAESLSPPIGLFSPGTVNAAGGPGITSFQAMPGFGKTGGYRVTALKSSPIDDDDDDDSPSDDDEDANGNDDELDDEHSSDVLSSAEQGVDSVTSSWGEWKAKVIQSKIQLKMGDEENQGVLSAVDSERERDAELADAEI